MHGTHTHAWHTYSCMAHILMPGTHTHAPCAIFFRAAYGTYENAVHAIYTHNENAAYGMYIQDAHGPCISMPHIPHALMQHTPDVPHALMQHTPDVFIPAAYARYANGLYEGTMPAV